MRLSSYVARRIVTRTLLGALAFGACLSVVAADYPKRKAGLWELTRSAANPKYPPQVQRICLDAVTDALLYQAGENAGRKLCSKIDRHTVDGTFVIDTMCALGQTQASTHTVMTFSGDGAYQSDISVHFDPPLGRTGDTHTTQDAKWLGVCPDDMKPGDIVTEPSPLMPVPIRMNVRDMLKQNGSP